MSRKHSKPEHRPGPVVGTISRSLHTPTALASLAFWLVEYRSNATPAQLIREAARVLRVPGADSFGPSDPTFQAALKTYERIAAQEGAE
jgi:hypothetical protein